MRSIVPHDCATRQGVSGRGKVPELRRDGRHISDKSANRHTVGRWGKPQADSKDPDHRVRVGPASNGGESLMSATVLGLVGPLDAEADKGDATRTRIGNQGREQSTPADARGCLFVDGRLLGDRTVHPAVGEVGGERDVMVVGSADSKHVDGPEVWAGLASSRVDADRERLGRVSTMACTQDGGLRDDLTQGVRLDAEMPPTRAASNQVEVNSESVCMVLPCLNSQRLSRDVAYCSVSLRETTPKRAEAVRHPGSLGPRFPYCREVDIQGTRVGLRERCLVTLADRCRPGTRQGRPLTKHLDTRTCPHQVGHWSRRKWTARRATGRGGRSASYGDQPRFGCLAASFSGRQSGCGRVSVWRRGWRRG
jgi:hypothetical protein